MPTKTDLRKRLGDIFDTLRREGWEVTQRRNGHMKAKSPEGNVVFISRTPSDWRALEKIKRDLKHNGAHFLKS